MRVQILTPGCTTPNGAALLFPIVRYRHALAARGIDVRLVDAPARAGDCDVLVVDSKFHRSKWETETDAVVAEFETLKRRTGRLLYFDTTDSTGMLQVEILGIVDLYCKNQLLRDRRLYLKPMYGARIFSDFFHERFAATDARPLWSQPVSDASLLGKLAVSWNSGLADYSPSGRARAALYRRLRIPALLRFPKALAGPNGPRPVDISCRFGANYSRESVAWQRKTVRQRLARRAPMERLERGRYFRELAQSKIVVSPFGWGEINYRDYETFLTAGLLLKPDMSHLETWPDFFRPGETIITHRWDLSDLEERIDEALADYPRFRAIAAEGQTRYLRHLGTPAAEESFADRFLALISRAATRLQSRAAS